MRTEPEDVLDAVVRGWPFARPSWLGGARYTPQDECELAETVIEIQDCDLLFDEEPTLVDDRAPRVTPAPPAIWSPCA